MILDNPFVCSNGHNFNANAKIRARCPECGITARRSFEKVEPVVEVKPIVTTDSIAKPTRKTVLLRRGRPREVMPKNTKAGHNVGSSKVKLAKRTVKTKPKILTRKATSVASGLVKTHTIKGKVLPKVRRPPKPTAVARHIKLPLEHGGSYLDHVMDRFGPG